jgi:hypothetical protein
MAALVVVLVQLVLLETGIRLQHLHHRATTVEPGLALPTLALAVVVVQAPLVQMEQALQVGMVATVLHQVSAAHR